MGSVPEGLAELALPLRKQTQGFQRSPLFCLELGGGYMAARGASLVAALLTT